MGIYILSRRGLISSVSDDPVFELEDLLVQTCDAQLLVPSIRGVTNWIHEHPGRGAKLLDKIVSKTIGPYNLVDKSFQSLDEPKILIVIAISGPDLTILSSIPKWREQFDVVAAYIFDAWAFEYYPKYTRLLDHLFVPMPELIEPLREYFGIPVSLLPFASDVLTYGSDEINRSIDLISYGRIPKQYHSAFSKKFNQPDSGRIYYHSTPRSTERFPKKTYEERRDLEDQRLLSKMLTRTKLALAFDTLYPGMRKFPYSFVTLRWFQCGAAGCAIVGKRPTTPLADELLNWEDATIELPEDPQESVEFIEALLQDKTRLHSIHKRNYLENLAQHDWRLRIKSMFEQLDLPLPKRLVDELTQLKVLHSKRRNELHPLTSYNRQSETVVFENSVSR